MIEYQTKGLEHTRDLLAREQNVDRFLASLDLRPEQESYFMDRGVDDGAKLRPRTIQARAKGYGHYKNPPRSGVTSTGPFAAWTGETLNSTVGEGPGSREVGGNKLTIKTPLLRRIDRFWDFKTLRLKLDAAYADRIQKILNGRRPPRHTPLNRGLLR